MLPVVLAVGWVGSLGQQLLTGVLCMGALTQAIANLLEPGEKILVGNNGIWVSRRWGQRHTGGEWERMGRSMCRPSGHAAGIEHLPPTSIWA